MKAKKLLSKSEEKRIEVLEKAGFVAEEKKEVEVSPIQAPEVKNVRGFTAEEFMQLQELHRICVFTGFLKKTVQDNTVMFTEGQKFAQNLEALANLCLGQKQSWISSTLGAMGYEVNQKYLINMQTGEVKIDTNINGSTNSK